MVVELHTLGVKGVKVQGVVFRVTFRVTAGIFGAGATKVLRSTGG